MFKKIFRFFSRPVALSSFNFLLITILIAGNAYWPVACIPTPWAICALCICFLSVIAYPLVKSSILSSILSVINGISFFTFIYLIIFLSSMNVFGFMLILVGIGLLAFIPHFIVGQLIRNYLLKPRHPMHKKLFLTGFTFSILLMLYSGISYYNAANKIIEARQKSFDSIEKGFMTEKILGMHFIYHTRYCFYDGWRPPKHEPLMVMGMWLNGYSPLGNGLNADPLHIDLEERIALYKRIYPENKIKFDCACSYEDHRAYHADQIWD